MGIKYWNMQIYVFLEPSLSLIRTWALRRVGCLLCCDLLVDGVVRLRQGAVHVEPPVTDEVLLVEQSPIGAEETVLGQTTVSEVGTNVEWLAVSLWVSVVTLIYYIENQLLSQQWTVKVVWLMTMANRTSRDSNRTFLSYRWVTVWVWPANWI